MSNDLMTKSVEFEVNGEPVKLTGATVKNYLLRGNAEVTDQEIVMFINLCKYQKLNPFLNEAYLVKFKNKSGPDAPAQIITSKEAFMKRAEANEHYAGLEAGIIVERDGQLVDIEGAIKLPNDTLIGGWARVFRDDRKVPIKVRISLEEFSKSQATWKNMPLNMIRKTAIVNAMREAFPGNLGNMYTEEEQSESVLASRPSTEETVKREIKKKANSEIFDMEYEEVNDDKPVDPPKEPGKKSAFDEEGPGF